jgi:Ulp1 family protease
MPKSKARSHRDAVRKNQILSLTPSSSISIPKQPISLTRRIINSELRKRHAIAATCEKLAKEEEPKVSPETPANVIFDIPVEQPKDSTLKAPAPNSPLKNKLAKANKEIIKVPKSAEFVETSSSESESEESETQAIKIIEDAPLLETAFHENDTMQIETTPLSNTDESSSNEAQDANGSEPVKYENRDRGHLLELILKEMQPKPLIPPIDDTQIQSILKTRKLFEAKTESIQKTPVVYQPENQVTKEEIQIHSTSSDLERLKKANQKLNDTIINDFLRIITQDKHRIAALSTYAFYQLANYGLQSALNRKYLWPKDVNFKHQKKILIPVNLSDHWSLYHINVKVSRIDYYDSMKFPMPHIDAILDFLNHFIGKRNWRIQTPACPTQTSHITCGVFVCEYARSIVQDEAKMEFDNENIENIKNFIYQTINSYLK